jgi:hypothetical protein
LHGFVTLLKPHESEFIVRQIAVSRMARWPQILQDRQGFEF